MRLFMVSGALAVVIGILPTSLFAQTNQLATVQIYNDASSPIVELLSYDLKTETYSKNLLKNPLESGKAIKIPLKAGQYYLFAYVEVAGEKVEVSSDYQFSEGELTYWHIDDADLQPQENQPYDEYGYEDPYAYDNS
jgi:hypothetical protein